MAFRVRSEAIACATGDRKSDGDCPKIYGPRLFGRRIGTVPTARGVYGPLRPRRLAYVSGDSPPRRSFAQAHLMLAPSAYRGHWWGTIPQELVAQASSLGQRLRSLIPRDVPKKRRQCLRRLAVRQRQLAACGDSPPGAGTTRFKIRKKVKRKNGKSGRSRQNTDQSPGHVLDRRDDPVGRPKIASRRQRRGRDILE
jgi:hypothetical protein